MLRFVVSPPVIWQASCLGSTQDLAQTVCLSNAIAYGGRVLDLWSRKASGGLGHREYVLRVEGVSLKIVVAAPQQVSRVAVQSQWLGYGTGLGLGGEEGGR